MKRALGGLAVAAAASVVFAQPAALSQSYWLRSYPLQAYSGYWRLNLKVKDLDKTMKVLPKQLEKAGGEPTLPLANFVSSQSHRFQQISYRIPAKNAGKTVDALKKLGTVQDDVRSPAAGPDVVAEVRRKLDDLRADVDSNKDALARMPTVSAVISELIAHLQMVEKTQTEAKERILLNLELRQE